MWTVNFAVEAAEYQQARKEPFYLRRAARSRFRMMEKLGIEYCGEERTIGELISSNVHPGRSHGEIFDTN
jgi:hypothetical protein